MAGDYPSPRLRTTSEGFRVTFGDPVATSLQTSLQELTPLRNATGISHPDPFWSEARIRITSK